MVLTDEDIQDLVKGTLRELGRLRFNQIATDLQNYEVMGRIMRRDRVRFDSGTSIQRSIMVSHSGAAKMVGLYGQDNINVGDTLQQINAPWRHTTVPYAFDRREITMNGGASKIVDLLKVRRTDAMLSLAELMEAQFWGKPTNSDDKLNLWGVQYWLVRNASVGFNGGVPSGFTDVAGLNPSTYAKWKNYTGGYSAVSKSDLIKKMRTGHRKINFKSPVDIPSFRKGQGDRYRIYVNETTISEMETLGEQQNENLGRDLASMDGVMTFKRNPIIWVPYLDSDTQNPVYMLNFSTFYPFFLKGEYLRESGPKQSATQHTVFEVHTDLTWNVLMDDRRSNAVFHKV